MPNPQRQLLSAVDMYIPPGRRFYTDGARAGDPREKQAFTYSATFNGASALTPLGTVQIGIAIDSDADFLAFNIVKISTLANNTTFIPLLPATLLLTTTGGGSRLSDQPQHIENFVGAAGLPGVPPWPIWLPGSSVLQVQLTSLDPVNTFNVFIGFPGVKIF
jgi:hypothetical protein